MKGRILIIAGSDPSGGAGIQADIKTVTALGGYGASAITAITVQNTMGVTGVHPVPVDLIKAQIDAVMGDIGADAIKIGMIGDSASALMLADFLAGVSIPVVLDPVLGATSGDRLAGDDVASVILEKLSPHVSLLTPNADELAALAGGAVPNTPDEMAELGEKLFRSIGTPLLLKGGHLEGDELVDRLVSEEPVRAFRHKRIETTSTHGTGCTLASAIAIFLAQGLSLSVAVERAIDYVHGAIKAAPGYGEGQGPLNHSWQYPQQ